jgi:von Willebrand factor type A domain
MHRPAPPARGKVVVAVAVSLLVHALVGLAWWAGADRSAVAAPALGTAVDGPDDRETIFVLRDPPSERPPPSPQPVAEGGATSPPATLPPTLTGSDSKPPGPGAPAQTVISPAGHQSSLNSTGAKPLHGPLRPGKSVVYVLDRSASMGIDGLLPRAGAAIKASLGQLGPDVRFGIVAYNGGASSFSPALLAATPENVRRAGAWLDQLPAEGRSNHVAGVRDGLWLHPDAIVLLTDADDLDDGEVRAIAKLMRAPVRLSVAIFGSARPARQTPLERLVREHAGVIQYVER